LFDKEIRQSEALCIKGQHILGVIPQFEHGAKGDRPSGSGKIEEHPVIFCSFLRMLHTGGGAFIGPTRQWSTKMGRQDHVGDFVREDRIHDSPGRALNGHSPTEHLPPVENKRCCSPRAQTFSDMSRDKTRLGPVWKRSA